MLKKTNQFVNSLSFINRNNDGRKDVVNNLAIKLENSDDNKQLPSPKKTNPTIASEDVLKLEPVDFMLEKKKSTKNFFTRTESLLKLRKDSEKLDVSESMNIPHYLQFLTTIEDNGKRLFGIPLETIMKRSNEQNEIPNHIYKIADYLEENNALKEEGIFRVCGNQSNILSLINEIESGNLVNLSKYDIHEIANCFKLYFQLLPQPILTYKLYPRFMAAVCLEDTQLRNAYYNGLLATVPPLRRKLALFLLQFLKKVASFSDTNKMGPRNLGIVFGPLFLRRQNTSNDDVYKSYLHYSKYIINCTKHLIKCIDILFIATNPIEVVRTLTSYSAKKLGELDLKENSIIYIITKGDEECFAESDGRFGNLPSHFLFDNDGKLKCNTFSQSPQLKVRRVRSKKNTTPKVSKKMNINFCFFVNKYFLC